jgi:hypothetical protein
VITLINQIIALIINHANQIQAIATAAVLIHFFPFDTFLSSDHEDKTKNQQYSIYTKATEANIPKIQLIAIFIKAKKYQSSVL